MTYTYIAPIITNIIGIENVSVFLLLFGASALYLGISSGILLLVAFIIFSIKGVDYPV